VRERSEKTGLIDEFRDVLVGGLSTQVKVVGDGGVDAYIKFFLSVGNTAYKAGDADVFEYFIKSLQEVVEAKPEGLNCADLISRMRDYGFRAIRDFDLAMFEAIVEVFSERIISMRDVVEISGWLEFLMDLGLRSSKDGFEEGVLTVVDAFRLLGTHFDRKGLGVSSMSLKNHVVELVHYLDGVENESLRERVISQVEDVLMPPKTAKP
jgi:hypothetical protein